VKKSTGFYVKASRLIRTKTTKQCK